MAPIRPNLTLPYRAKFALLEKNASPSSRLSTAFSLPRTNFLKALSMIFPPILSLGAAWLAANRLSGHPWGSLFAFSVIIRVLLLKWFGSFRFLDFGKTSSSRQICGVLLLGTPLITSVLQGH